MCRVAGFNKRQVQVFYNNLKGLLQLHNFPAERIFNVDESGISNVHTPEEIISLKEKRQVERLTSAEREKTTTIVCAYSAAGQYIPTMIIFARKRMNERLMKGAPPGAIFHFTYSGWIDQDGFLAYIDHFSRHANASAQNPALLLLDGHASHKSLPVILKAFNPDIFEDSDFIAADTLLRSTGREENTSDFHRPDPNPDHPQTRVRTAEDESSATSLDKCKLTECEKRNDSSSIPLGQIGHRKDTEEFIPLGSTSKEERHAKPSSGPTSRSIESISPIRKNISSNTISRKGRKPEKSVVLTSSPNKEFLEKKHSCSNRRVTQRVTVKRNLQKKARYNVGPFQGATECQMKNDVYICLVCQEMLSGPPDNQ